MFWYNRNLFLLLCLKHVTQCHSDSVSVSMRWYMSLSQFSVLGKGHIYCSLMFMPQCTCFQISEPRLLKCLFFFSFSTYRICIISLYLFDLTLKMFTTAPGLKTTHEMWFSKAGPVRKKTPLWLPCCVKRRPNENWWHNYKHKCMCGPVSKRSLFPPLFTLTVLCLSLPFHVKRWSANYSEHRVQLGLFLQVNKYNCLRLGKTAAAIFVPLWLSQHFPDSFVIDRTFFLVLEITKLWGDFRWLFHIIICHYSTFNREKGAFDLSNGQKSAKGQA